MPKPKRPAAPAPRRLPGTARLARQKAVLRSEVAELARHLNVTPSGVFIQHMSTKWASCSRTGRLSFSLALLDQPADFRRRVIVHELLHLRIPNHSRLFRAVLRATIATEPK